MGVCVATFTEQLVCELREPSSSKATSSIRPQPKRLRNCSRRSLPEAFKQMAEGFNAMIEDFRIRVVPEEAMQSLARGKVARRKIGSLGVSRRHQSGSVTLKCCRRISSWTQK